MSKKVQIDIKMFKNALFFKNLVQNSAKTCKNALFFENLVRFKLYFVYIICYKLYR